VAATVAMSGLMVVAERGGWMSRHPPEEIVDRSVRRATGRRPPEPVRRLLGSAAHLGIGAIGGAGFGLAWSGVIPLRWRLAIPPSLLGMVYATGIWALSYLGWLPALGLMPPAHEDEPTRPTALVVAHWIYGGVLGAAIARLPPTRRGRARSLLPVR
jgi:uncharacterized protein DUF6789